MKKYKSLLNHKQKLEKQIAQLCNKFTDKTGLIVRHASMVIDIQTKETPELVTKILSNYNVEINCEV